MPKPVASTAVAEKPVVAEKPKGLAESKVKVLDLLSRNPNGLSRVQLAERTGIKKGWSKLLGSPTKEGGTTSGMEADGLVKSAKIEGERGLTYTITANGKKALATAQKAAK